MLVKLISFVALAATSAAAVATPTTRDAARALNPPASAVNGREIFEPQLEARVVTNAKRLADGLPLNPPRRRSSEVARSSPSGTVCSVRGYLQVKDGSNALGFLASAWNSFGEYTAVTNDAAKRLVVNIDICSDRTNILATNGPSSSYPYVGGITGYSSPSSDIGPGRFNYGYLGGTGSTPVFSPPISGPNSFTAATGISKQIESAIYRYNPATKEITAQWINTDLAQPATYFGITQNVFVFTGDKTSFTNSFGSTQWISFFFVPA